ncbi:hypothetical protein B296_00022726 [Ensete ventricosum]|uniref:Uncharacterized protein n=1 Tax=Ensete ventricosum TaxID=4639 RepID=A0A427AN49_ENSVE|nr:hypothetical protein B296_00022726 [Ensete ventricosum]
MAYRQMMGLILTKGGGSLTLPQQAAYRRHPNGKVDFITAKSLVRTPNEMVGLGCCKRQPVIWQQRHLLTRRYTNIPYPTWKSAATVRCKRRSRVIDCVRQKTRERPFFHGNVEIMENISGCRREAECACSRIITSSQRYDVEGKRIQLHHWQLVLATHNYYAFSDNPHPNCLSSSFIRVG